MSVPVQHCEITTDLGVAVEHFSDTIGRGTCRGHAAEPLRRRSSAHPRELGSPASESTPQSVAQGPWPVAAGTVSSARPWCLQVWETIFVVICGVSLGRALARQCAPGGSLAEGSATRNRVAARVPAPVQWGGSVVV